MSAPSELESRRRLAGRLFGLWLIPTAVFCAVFAFVRAALGTDPQALGWTFVIALAACVASAFAFARLAASALAGEIEAVSVAVRHAAAGAEPPPMPELTPPLEDLKREVVAIAKDSAAQQSRLLERLDTSRQQIFFLTNHDALTGLANRKTIEEKLETMIATARQHGRSHGLLILDVDLFHRFNDAFGHLAGDELLRRLAPILRGALREGEVIGRLGGDEFGVLLENVPPAYATETAMRLRDTVQAWQFEWAGGNYQVGISVGVVAITRLTPSPAAALAEADTAVFTAKEQGRNRVFSFFDKEATQSVRKTSRGWLKRINDALAEGAFTLVYQPILPVVGFRGMPVRRVEALLRMGDTGGEMVLPMSFIPVAERYDLMRLIDRWVVDRALADYQRLARERAVASPAEFSLNLSGHTLSSADFGDYLLERMTHYEVPANSLFLEITETAAIDHIERAQTLVERMRALGVRFYLDDFGNGLSSFNYLKHFPVDGIKIDGLFVRGIATSDLDRALVESIHRIANHLSLETVAEHVESEDIATRLAAMGITLGQGFHIAAPAPLEAIFGAA